MNAEEALRPGAPLIWPEAPQNRAYVFERGDAAAVEAAFARADHRIDCALINNRIAAAALEPRIAIANHDAAAGRFSLLISGASVHAIRRELAVVFGVPESRIDVACPDVGGGFGMKNVLYPEFVALLQGARLLDRPIVDVRVLGSSETPEWERTESHLEVVLPEQETRGIAGAVVRIELESPAPEKRIDFFHGLGI